MQILMIHDTRYYGHSENINEIHESLALKVQLSAIRVNVYFEKIDAIKLERKSMQLERKSMQLESKSMQLTIFPLGNVLHQSQSAPAIYLDKNLLFRILQLSSDNLLRHLYVINVLNINLIESPLSEIQFLHDIFESISLIKA